MSNVSVSTSPGYWLKKVIFVLAVFGIVFGALTVFSGGLVLFGPTAVKEQAGQIVPWVLWFNFLAGFVYILAGTGIMLRKKWALLLTASIAVASLLVFATLGFHITTGGAFEMRTLIAMTFRTTMWTMLAIMLYVLG